MKLVFLLFFLISHLPANESPEITLTPENWIGLGFFLALFPEHEKTQHYQDCYGDDKLFMALSRRSWQGQILAAVKWENEVLVLQSREQKNVYCRRNKQGIIPELVFFKDLLDASQLYKDKDIWTKIDFFYILDNQRRSKRYPLKKFTRLTVSDIEPAPVSNHHSVRIFCRSQETNMEGYFDIGLTGINRLPPLPKLTDYCFLENPSVTFQLNEQAWQAAQEGRVIKGMPAEIVQIILGSPLNSRIDRNEVLRLFYPAGRQGRIEYVFYRNKLFRINNYQDDEFPSSNLF